jgi:hypothetical protein
MARASEQTNALFRNARRLSTAAASSTSLLRPTALFARRRLYPHPSSASSRLTHAALCVPLPSSVWLVRCRLLRAAEIRIAGELQATKIRATDELHTPPSSSACRCAPPRLSRRCCSEKCMFQVYVSNVSGVSSACCRCFRYMLQVLCYKEILLSKPMLQSYVSIVSRTCCRCCVARRCCSQSRCCNPMFQLFREHVAGASGT